MNNEAVIILHKFNGENQTWDEIPKGTLDSWMSDGSIEEGDTIIYPQKSQSVIMEKTLRLIGVKQSKTNETEESK